MAYLPIRAPLSIYQRLSIPILYDKTFQVQEYKQLYSFIEINRSEKVDLIADRITITFQHRQ